jgi:formate hydrogenlyase subunit 4
MSDMFFSYLWQLIALSPVLIACLIGMILSLVFWRHSPVPCMLAMLGAGLMFVVSIGSSFISIYLSYYGMEEGWDYEGHGRLMAVVGVIGSLLRAVAIGLLLSGVFLGRRSATQSQRFARSPSTGPARPIGMDEGVTDRPEF